jgi:hypothetical protein
MSYEENKVCLYGENARQFLKHRVGEKVKLSIEAVITSTGLEDYYEDGGSDGTKRPVVEFQITDVSGKKKGYDEMGNSEIEQEINNVMSGEDTGKGKPNREDGGSIWDDVKAQEKLNRTPFKRSPATILR